MKIRYITWSLTGPLRLKYKKARIVLRHRSDMILEVDINRQIHLAAPRE